MKRWLMFFVMGWFLAMQPALLSALVWETGGSARWTEQSDGSWRSGSISHNSSTWIQTTVSGVGGLTFSWKVSSENSYDRLTFYIDGIEKNVISGSVDWRKQSYTITGTGTHTLRWGYSKDGSVVNGSDCGWIRDIVFNPLEIQLEGNEYVVTGLVNKEFSGRVEIPAAIDGVSITKIADSAFKGCVGVTSVIIPSSVTSIGENAFEGCTSLSEIYFDCVPPSAPMTSFPASIQGFYTAQFSSEWEGVIQEGVWNGMPMSTKVVLLTFDANGGTGGKTIELPWGATLSAPSVSLLGGTLQAWSPILPARVPTENMKYTAQWSVPSLYYSVSNNKATVVDLDESFSGELQIPCMLGGYSVTSIGSDAFYNCTKLTSVTIPKGVTSIGDYAFRYCSSLTSVTIPSSVTSIGYYAFNGVSPRELTTPLFPSGMSKNNLKTLVISDGATSISGSAFYGCSSLTSVTIPSSVTSIGSSAFTGCSALKKVVFLGAPPSGFGSSSFSATRFYYPTGTAELLEAWTAKFESLTSWGTTEFVSYNRQQDGLLYQASGGSATVVGTYEKLPYTLVVPERIGSRYAVKTIGNKAFMTQNSVVSLQLPKAVTTIQDGAFKDCTALKSVEFMGTPPASVADDAFLSAQGYYWPEAETAWANVVDESGKWKNLSFDVLTAHADGWLYKEAADSITVVRADATLSGQLVIPEMINGKAVTTIAADAFVGQDGITAIVIPEGVITIGDRAFEGCTAVMRVNLPSTLTTVGTRAFTGVAPETLVAAWLPKGMSSERLVHLTIPAGVTTIPSGAFTNASKIETLIIPLSVTSVASDSFSGVAPKVLTSWFIPSNMTRSKIETLVIPEGRTSLTANAFENCTALKTVSFPSTLTMIGNYAFNGCTLWEDELVLPTGVTSIGSYAFQNCALLKGVLVIPEGVTTISSYAFYGCSGLTGLTLHDAITKVDTYAFYGCTSITGAIAIPRTAMVNSYAFTNVAPTKVTAVALLGGMLGTNLEEIVVPEGTTSVSASAFSGCNKAERVFLPASVTSVGTDAFKNVAPTTLQAPFLPSGMSKSSVVTLALPQGMTEVIDSAFAYCTSVDAVVIPEGVTKIGKSSFYGCESMKTLKLAESVETIGNQAFCGCSALEGLTIPSKVKAIGSYAFSLCSKVTQVYFEGLPPEIPNGAFAFDDFSDMPTEGYYLESVQDAWAEVIDEGWWDNLYMSTYTSGGAGSGSGGTGGGVMPDEETPVARYAVKVKVVGCGSVAGAGMYAVGDTVTLTATAGEEAVFCGWSVPSVKSRKYTFTMPEMNAEVVAYFADATIVENYVNINGLLTKDELKDLALSTPVIEVKDGVATVSVQILKCLSLEDEWEDVGAVSVDFDADEKAGFYKFVVPNKQ